MRKDQTLLRLVTTYFKIVAGQSISGNEAGLDEPASAIKASGIGRRPYSMAKVESTWARSNSSSCRASIASSKNSLMGLHPSRPEF